MTLKIHYNPSTEANLDGVNGLGPSLVHTRNSEASFQDWEGNTRTVNIDEPRLFGYRRVQQMFHHTRDLTNLYWTNSNTVDTVDTTIAPDGTLTAYKLLATDTGGVTALSIYANEIIEFDSYYAVSWYVKADTLSDCTIFVTNLGTTNPRAGFNLATEQTRPISGNGALTSGIEDARLTYPDSPAGWLRIWAVFLSNSIDNNGTFWLSLADSNGNTSLERDGINSLWIWSPQLEEVSGQISPAPSEFIESTTLDEIRVYNTGRRTNLFTISDPTQADITGATNGVTDKTADIPGFTNGLHMPVSGGTTVYFYYPGPIFYNIMRGYEVGEWYTLSFYILMDDGNPPVPGWSTNTGDFTCNIAGSVIRLETDVGMELVSGNLYRVWSRSKTWNPVGHSGVLNYTGNSDRTFNMSGFQLEKGNTMTDYIPSTGTITSSAFNIPLQESEQFLRLANAKTNKLLKSENYTVGAEWSEGGSGIDITPRAAIGPDGKLNATELRDDARGGTFVSRVQQNIITFEAGKQYALWARYKALDNTWATISVQVLNGQQITSYFDIGNGVLGNSQGADTKGRFIIPLKDSWYACGVIFDAFSGDTDAVCMFSIALSDGVGSFTMDGSNSILICGSQLEEGEYSDYIKTEDTIVTREAENAVATLTDEFNEEYGTIYTKHRKIEDDQVTGAIVTFDDDTLTNYHQVLMRNTDGAQFNILNANLQFSPDATNTYIKDQFIETASSYSRDNANYYVDGTFIERLLIVSDDFNRPGPDLGVPWTLHREDAYPLPMNIIVDGKVKPLDGIGGEFYYGGQVYDLELEDNQFCEVELSDFINGDFVLGDCSLNMYIKHKPKDSGSIESYYYYCAIFPQPGNIDTVNVLIVRRDPDFRSDRLSDDDVIIPGTIPDGIKFRFECIGGVFASYYDIGGGWVLMSSVTDSAWIGGRAGFGVTEKARSLSGDNFRAGNIVQVPTGISKVRLGNRFGGGIQATADISEIRYYDAQYPEHMVQDISNSIFPQTLTDEPRTVNIRKEERQLLVYKYELVHVVPEES